MSDAVQRPARLVGTIAFLAFFILSPIVLVAQSTSIVPSPADTATEVRCVDVPAGLARPAVGCFNVGHLAGLTFTDTLVVWRLYRFPTVAAAEQARGARGVVASAEGAGWLSDVTEVGAVPRRPAAGTLVATSQPLALPAAPSYAMSLAYAVFRPGMRSRVHVHAGPEAFHVLAAPSVSRRRPGVVRTAAGGTSSIAAGVPMALEAAGSRERRAFAVIVHDARHPQAEPASWQRAGACAH